MSGARRLLIVDFKNNVYRAAAANGSLFGPGRVFTGGLYGFLVSLCAAINATHATHVVCATDTPPYRRLNTFPEYKGDRKRDNDEEHKVLVMKGAITTKQLHPVLDMLGIPVWSMRGFEYDDICAWAVEYHRNRFDRLVAMSNDTDLYQLLDVRGFSVYRGAKASMYDRAAFVREWGDLSRAQWIDFLSLTGTHNAVPGIKGIGPKRAADALKKRSVFDALYRDHGELIERNRDLITLPHSDFPSRPFLFLGDHSGIVLRDFARACARYDIQVTGSMLEALQDLRNNGH